jgi:hypothetical protein
MAMSEIGERMPGYIISRKPINVIGKEIVIEEEDEGIMAVDELGYGMVIAGNGLLYEHFNFDGGEVETDLKAGLYFVKEERDDSGCLYIKVVKCICLLKGRWTQ